MGWIIFIIILICIFGSSDTSSTTTTRNRKRKTSDRKIDEGTFLLCVIHLIKSSFLLWNRMNTTIYIATIITIGNAKALFSEIMFRILTIVSILLQLSAFNDSGCVRSAITVPGFHIEN